MPKLGDDIGAVWIATTPRTGSMWTTNVVREIVRIEGFDRLPERHLNDKSLLQYGTQHLEEKRPGVAVLKVHLPVPPLPRSAGIVTQRDVRDVVVSYMRFMRKPFEEGLPLARSALGKTPETWFAGDRRLLVNYSDITTQPALVVRSIAGFLGADRAALQSEDIAAKFSKSEVKARIDAAEAEIKAMAKAGEKIERDRLVILSPTNWRVLDRETDFQTGHVSDYRDGDWKTVLTPDQQAQLNALIEKAGHSLV